MNKILLLLILTSVFASSYSQKKSSNSDSFEQANNKYHNALKYLDYHTAISAVHDILLIAPEKTMYKDSLLILYFNNNQSLSAVLLAKELELEGNTSKNVLEVLAISFQNAGQLKESLSYYEKLNTQDNSLFYMYQIAVIQYSMSRISECTQTLTKIIEDPNSSKETVKIEYENNPSQQVPFSAAAYNILGVLSLNLNNNEVAKRYFENALKIFPEFLLAKSNISAGIK